eukprot:3148248-Prymnesium_polylepis.1
MARTAGPFVFEWCAPQAPPRRPLNHVAAGCFHESLAPPTRGTKSNSSYSNITCVAWLLAVSVRVRFEFALACPESFT